MLKGQEDKRSMYFVVKDVCNKYKLIWIKFKAFGDVFGDFELNLLEIDVQSQIQAGNKTGIATDKRKLCDEMIQMGIEVSGAVYSFASKLGNNELMNKIDYSYTKLYEMRDTILKDNCQIIHDEANKVIGQLADYGKTASDLEVFQGIINKFVEILEKPRVATTIIKGATAKLKELFKSEDNILKGRMDRLMVIYKRAEPKFYNEYRAARKIINTSIQITSLIVSVRNANGTVIPRVLAKISNISIDTNSNEVINEISKRTTAIGGVFKVVSMAEGNYKAVFTKMGYTSQTVNFTIISGETTKLDLIMAIDN